MHRSVPLPLSGQKNKNASCHRKRSTQLQKQSPTLYPRSYTDQTCKAKLEEAQSKLQKLQSLLVESQKQRSLQSTAAEKKFHEQLALIKTNQDNSTIRQLRQQLKQVDQKNKAAELKLQKLQNTLVESQKQCRLQLTAAEEQLALKTNQENSTIRQLRQQLKQLGQKNAELLKNMRQQTEEQANSEIKQLQQKLFVMKKIHAQDLQKNEGEAE